MQQPNPWILLMGGIALLNVSMMVSGIHAAAWIRYGGMAICIALGVTAMGARHPQVLQQEARASPLRVEAAARLAGPTAPRSLKGATGGSANVRRP